MKFFRIVLHDITEGTLRRPYFIFVPLITFFICQRAFYTFSEHGVATIGDYFIFCMAGIEPFQFGMGEQFRFPIQWIILLGGMLYTSLNYPRQDIGTYGQQMLIRMDSRMTWWLSKWTWLFLNALILFLTYIVTIVLFSIYKGVPFALASSPDMTDLLYTNYWDYISISLSGNEVKLISIILPFLVLFSLSALQLLLTLIISPMFSFFLILSVLIVSAFATSPLLIGNYAMSQRSTLMIKNGVNPCEGIWILVIAILIIFIVGAVMFKRTDILPVENE